MRKIILGMVLVIAVTSLTACGGYRNNRSNTEWAYTPLEDLSFEIDDTSSKYTTSTSSNYTTNNNSFLNEETNNSTPTYNFFSNEDIKVNTPTSYNNSTKEEDTTSIFSSNTSSFSNSTARVGTFESPIEIGQSGIFDMNNSYISKQLIPASIKVVKKLSAQDTLQIFNNYNEEKPHIALKNHDTRAWTGGALIEVDFGDYKSENDIFVSTTQLSPSVILTFGKKAENSYDTLKDSTYMSMSAKVLPYTDKTYKTGEKIGTLKYIIIYELPTDYTDDYVVMKMGHPNFSETARLSYFKVPTK